MAERVARRAKNQHAAVAEKVVIAFKFHEVKFASFVKIRQNEKPRTGTPLELLRKPSLIEFFFLDHVDRIWKHRDVADVVQMRMRGDHDLYFVQGIAQLL